MLVHRERITLEERLIILYWGASAGLQGCNRYHQSSFSLLTNQQFIRLYFAVLRIIVYDGIKYQPITLTPFPLTDLNIHFTSS